MAIKGMEPVTVEVTPELLEAAQSIFDGWYAEEARIDWDDFIDRLEAATDINMGPSMVAPHVLAIQKHIRWYRRQG